jgi:hypothetical protein
MASECLGLAESGESIFRRMCGGAAMADDRRQESFDAAPRRNSR